MTELVLEAMITDGKGTVTSKYGKVNDQCAYIYAWMTQEDCKEVQQLKWLKEKILFFVMNVRYVGKDADASRDESRLSPFEIGTPFDRFLKVALIRGEKFVSIYLKV